MINKLKTLYIGAGNFLFPNKPDDIKFMGLNGQGFPVIGSEKEGCSFEFIIIDFKIK